MESHRLLAVQAATSAGEQVTEANTSVARCSHTAMNSLRQIRTQSCTARSLNPTTTDGYLYPAKEHFTGPMVLLTAPSACSGADQFAAMFIDNELGLSVGMPEGGCSNTWEWDETLRVSDLW